MAAAKRVTLKTIADSTGLAIATVSRALKGDLAIKEETRRRVQQAAIEVGYVPSSAGLRMRTGRSFTIAAVFPIGLELAGYSNTLINGIATALHGTKYSLHVCPYHPSDNALQRIGDLVESRAADGILLNAIKPEDLRVRYLLDKGFPFVTHGRSSWEDEHDYYDYDNQAFGRMAVERLVERGRKNVVVITPPCDQRFGVDLSRGCVQAAQATGAQLYLLCDVHGDCAVDVISKALTTKLAKTEGVDAIIAPTANACLASIDVIERLGLELGRDVDIVFKDERNVSVWIHKELIVIEEDTSTAGAALAKSLVTRIENPDAPLSQFVEPPVFF